MTYSITPAHKLDADIKLPASKSIGNRALILSALAGGGIVPANLSDCDDTAVMVKALAEMPDSIDIMAAGTAMRFLTAYLSVTPGEHVITGTERMRHRPIAALVDALRYIGADIEYVGESGFPPLRIRGRKMCGGKVEMDGSISSQFISAMLMIGPVLAEGLELKFKDSIVSRPYIDLTMWMMREFGAEVEWSSQDIIKVKSKPYTPRPYYIENDWSAASYWYEAMALSGKPDDCVTLEGLFDGSKQGDSIVRYIFSLLGVKTQFENIDNVANADNVENLENAEILDEIDNFCNIGKPQPRPRIILKNSGPRIHRLDYDFLSAPDLAQTVVVTCCRLGVPFRFTGLQSLKIKETDRIEALKTELRKLGYVIHSENESILFWDGERCEPQPEAAIDTYEDHRMALAFAPLCFAGDAVRINNPGVVTKSYPHYWEHLKTITEITVN